MDYLTCGKRRGWRKRIFLLGLYLLVTAILLLVSKQYQLINYMTVADLKAALKQKEILSNSTVSPILIGNSPVYIQHATGSITNDSSKPCFSSNYFNLEGQLKSTLEEKHMLPYFNTDSQYRVFVPQWLNNLNNGKPVNGTKYYIAAVLRVRLYVEDKARWTIRELKQWIHYQLFAGAEHVYICNHFLNQSEKFDADLADYINRGVVSVFEWDSIKSIPGSKTYQHDNAENQCKCYNHVLEHFKDDAVWHYNFDLDENPYVPGDRCEGFLTRHLKRQDSDISELRLSNYLLEGQGDRSRDIFYDRINRITPTPGNGNVKPIYRVSMTTEAGMHGAKTTGRCVYPKHEAIKLLHYWGSRRQKFGPDTAQLAKDTVEFNDVRNTLAVNVRHSLVAFGDLDAFDTKTGP